MIAQQLNRLVLAALVVGLVVSLARAQTEEPDSHTEPAAVTEVQSTRTLLEDLDARLRANVGSFTVQIQFFEALTPGETTWIIGDLTDPNLRAISEIGADYVCFAEAGAQSTFQRCTRFDNIVSISFFEAVE